IDIMEQLGHEPARVYGTVHWDDGGHKYLGSNTVIANPLEFHVYELEWTSNQIRIGVDGNFYFTMDITGTAKTEFHQPYYLLLNLAIGGNWPGYPDYTTVFPQYMFVDWVRVYQK
ncbi:MAG: glycoside hydrolase family 16 protein, partial [Brevinematales bacterium]|nr:glycoside hydrolase family 16 protein [Brevinematales bacterium]